MRNSRSRPRLMPSNVGGESDQEGRLPLSTRLRTMASLTSSSVHCLISHSALHMKPQAHLRARERHSDVRNHLLQAWETYRLTTLSGANPIPRVGSFRQPEAGKAQSCSFLEDGARGLTGAGVPSFSAAVPLDTAPSDDDQPPLDLVALAAMRRTVYPKLEMGGSSLDLYDKIIRAPQAPGGAESIVNVMGNQYLLPSGSTFLLSDITRLRPLLEEAKSRSGYNLLVIDPPWENASAKRSRCYETLPSRRLLSLPVRGLLSPEVRTPIFR